MYDYYKIESRNMEGDETLFSVTLLRDYCAYAGHFPGNPVTPGVCNIRMIKECAELLAGRRLFLAFIEKCKFTTVLTPHTTSQLKLRMHLSLTNETGSLKPNEQSPETYKVRATLYDDITSYINFKGEFYIPRHCEERSNPDDY